MSFSLDLAAFAEKAKGNIEVVVQKVAIDLLSAVVDRSPVGNPELWAANLAYQGKAKASADAYDANVEVRNVVLALSPSNYTKGGKLKRGVKYAKPLTKTERVQNFDVNGLVTGKDYVGGRFRGNWQVTFNVAASGNLERIDPQGSAAKAQGSGIIQQYAIGAGTIWITNNLPYGDRLEYEGWSSQAPAGMVRISVTEFQTFINNAVSGLSK